MKTLTLASIYEKQNFLNEALEIYQEIYKREPNNKEAIVAIERIKRSKVKFSGVNTKMRDLFVKMQSKEDYNEILRWLKQPCN